MLCELVRIVPACGAGLFLEFPWALTEIQGLGLPDINYRTTRSPFQHGATLLGFVLEPRVVQIILHLRGCTRGDMWQKRRDIINVLNPLLGPFHLEMHMWDGTIYSLHEVVYDGRFQATINARGEPTVQSIGVRMIAQDPVWFGPAQQIIFVPTELRDELVLPATFPIVFGTLAIIDETATATVQGNWEAYPTIEIYGPMGSSLIENTTTGEKLQLIYGTAVGEVVTIDTTPGNKSVTNNSGDNLVGYLTSDSDLATFHIDPAPLAPNGENTLHIHGAGSSLDAQITISWYDRYVGL